MDIMRHASFSCSQETFSQNYIEAMQDIFSDFTRIDRIEE
jgi:hypothetical protein